MTVQYFRTSSLIAEIFTDKKDEYPYRVVASRDFDNAVAREAALKVQLAEAMQLLILAKTRLYPSITIGGPSLDYKIQCFIDGVDPIYVEQRIIVTNCIVAEKRTIRSEGMVRSRKLWGFWK